MARVTGLEPAASGVTGRRSNQLSYTRVLMAAKYDTALTLSMAERKESVSLLSRPVCFSNGIADTKTTPEKRHKEGVRQSTAPCTGGGFFKDGNAVRKSREKDGGR